MRSRENFAGKVNNGPPPGSSLVETQNLKNLLLLSLHKVWVVKDFQDVPELDLGPLRFSHKPTLTVSAGPGTNMF